MFLLLRILIEYSHLKDYCVVFLAQAIAPHYTDA